MPHPLSHRLGSLVEARTGMSLNEFARKIGANASGLHKINRGERDSIDTMTFEKIAAGLHMTPAELHGEIGQGIPELSPEERRVIAALRQVGPAERTVAASAAEGTILSFRVQPTRTVSERRDASASKFRQQLRRGPASGKPDDNDPLATRYWHTGRLLARAGAQS